MAGFFITFEGGEGVGKSTQCRLLQEALKKKGLDCLLTREPGGSIGAEEIRDLLVKGDKGRWDSITETLLFMAARRNHLVSKIWPALFDNRVVICDRFLDSTLAYQGYGYGKKADVITQINTIYHMIAGDFKPDLTFILDIEPMIGLRRSRERVGNTDQRFETMELSFHQNLREGFLELAGQDSRYVVLDASGTVESLHEQILKIVEDRLK